jgi:hypothetical protein
MRDRMTLGVLAPALFLWAGAAQGECNSPGFNPNGNFCNGCRYEGSMVVTHDGTCERPYRPTSNARDFRILSNRIAQRAKHGAAVTNGNTLVYRPAKGYAGPDEFLAEVAYRQGSESGKFFVHFAVTVQ